MRILLIPLFLHHVPSADGAGASLADLMCVHLTGHKGAQCDPTFWVCVRSEGWSLFSEPQYVETSVSCHDERIQYYNEIYTTGIENVRLVDWGVGVAKSRKKLLKNCLSPFTQLPNTLYEFMARNPSRFTFGLPTCSSLELINAFSSVEKLKALMDMYLIIPGFAKKVGVKLAMSKMAESFSEHSIDPVRSSISTAFDLALSRQDKYGIVYFFSARGAALTMIRNPDLRILAKMVVRAATDQSLRNQAQSTSWHSHQSANSKLMTLDALLEQANTYIEEAKSEEWVQVPMGGWKDRSMWISGGLLPSMLDLEWGSAPRGVSHSACVSAYYNEFRAIFNAIVGQGGPWLGGTEEVSKGIRAKNGAANACWALFEEVKGGLDAMLLQKPSGNNGEKCNYDDLRSLVKAHPPLARYLVKLLRLSHRIPELFRGRFTKILTEDNGRVLKRLSIVDGADKKFKTRIYNHAKKILSGVDQGECVSLGPIFKEFPGGTGRETVNSDFLSFLFAYCA